MAKKLTQWRWPFAGDHEMMMAVDGAGRTEISRVAPSPCYTVYIVVEVVVRANQDNGAATSVATAESHTYDCREFSQSNRPPAADKGRRLARPVTDHMVPEIDGGFAAPGCRVPFGKRASSTPGSRWQMCRRRIPKPERIGLVDEASARR